MKNKIFVSLVVSGLLQTGTFVYSAIPQGEGQSRVDFRTAVSKNHNFSLTLQQGDDDQYRRMAIILGKILRNLTGNVDNFFEAWEEYRLYKVCLSNSLNCEMGIFDQDWMSEALIQSSDDSRGRTLQNLINDTSLNAVLLQVHDGRCTTPYFFEKIKKIGKNYEKNQENERYFYDDTVARSISEYCEEGIASLRYKSGSHELKDAFIDYENSEGKVLFFIEDDTIGELYLLVKDPTSDQYLSEAFNDALMIDTYGFLHRYFCCCPCND